MPFKWTFQSRNNYLTGILFTKQFMYHVWLGTYFIVMVREADIYRKVFSDSITTQRVFTGTMLYRQFVELLWLYNQPEQALTKECNSQYSNTLPHAETSAMQFQHVPNAAISPPSEQGTLKGLHTVPHLVLFTIILLYLTFSYTNHMLVYWEIYIYLVNMYFGNV